MDFREIVIPFPEEEQVFSHLCILQNGSGRQAGSYTATKGGSWFGGKMGGAWSRTSNPPVQRRDKE